jgi:putative ABC transport system permease protein
MIKNYLKTAFRFLLKNRTFRFINIIGLSIGTLCCLYILVYVTEQYSYDKWEDHAGDTYRVISDTKLSGDRTLWASSSPAIAAGMKRDFPEVQQYTRVFNAAIFGADQHLLKYKERSFFDKQVLFVDSTFFDLFTFPFLRGSAAGALSRPFTVVLSKPMADKLFGREDPIGKSIRINNKAGNENLEVTGVIDVSQARSHIQADVFVTMNSGVIGNIIRSDMSWGGHMMMFSYVKLRPGSDYRQLDKKLGPFMDRYGAKEMKTIGMEKHIHLQPISDIHTNADLQHDLTAAVSPSFLSMLSLIAVLIQVIACINFMNLSTARAAKRAKEVGVRKVIGAGRSDLIRQFLGESLLLSLIGVLLALPLLFILLPYLNQLTHADISLSFLTNYRVWLMMLALVLGTGLVSGSYPAFYLSAFQAIKVIKGNFTNRVSAAGLRRSLVVFQFSLSIMLITGVVIIYSQLDYIRKRDLGFDKSQRIVLNVYTDGANVSAMTDQLRLLPGVTTCTKSSSQLGKPIFQDSKYYLAGGNQNTGVDAMSMESDKYFAKTAGFRFLSGHDFRDFDSAKILINETLARDLGLDPMRAEGVKVYSKWSDSPVETYEIAGVVKDFNFNSLHEGIKPFLLICIPNSPSYSTVMVSCHTGDYKSLLDKMGAVWRRNVPGAPFEYAFLDEDVQKMYEADITLAKIINAFTAMAVLVSCLGLFGLAAFSAEQRSKEIGVRKVLGASVTGVVRLLSADFLKLVGIALLISVPVSWWAMNKWLAGFAYRVPMSWWMFGLSGLLAVLVAFLTVSFHTIRAASANPVRSLRSE